MKNLLLKGVVPLRKEISNVLFLTVVVLFLSACGSHKEVAQQDATVEENIEREVETEEKAEEKNENEAELEDEVSVVEEDIVEPEQIIREENRPHVAREFRAAWVASVANINWPSRPGLSTQEQQREAIDLLDMLEKYHFNAVILQVRPQTDALYESKLEPWSYFLTGEQGKAPNPYYDPLRFWIEAAHDRGIELHAWLNPYRAHHSTGKTPSPQSIIHTNPDLVVKLKNGMYWMDPGLKGTQEHSLAVVKDLVSRYDLDGIHFDDYFYPYASYNGGQDFPDNKSWAIYKKNGGELSRGDWRRDNVNTFVHQVYETIKAEKPNVKFGISPFGIWRPGYPKSIVGSDPYEELYADSKLWFQEGWVDYLMPQLYWKINQIPQSFPVLLSWWQEQNKRNRHLWPGIRIDWGGGDVNIDEVINQIMITRGMEFKNPGVAHWSIAPLLKYPELPKALLRGPYSKATLAPESPWLEIETPASPIITVDKQSDKLHISWTKGDEKEVFRWVVYVKTEKGWNYTVLNRHTTHFDINDLRRRTKEKQISAIAVTAVSKTESESAFQIIEVEK